MAKESAMRRLAALGACVLFGAGCGATGTPIPAAATSPAPLASPTVAPLKFQVAGVGSGNAEVNGTVEVTRAADHFTVRFRLHGMAPGTTHVDHIHSGSCANNGAIVYALMTLVADSSGDADATTDLQHSYAGDGWYANVHMGPDLATPENRAPLACGNLAAG